MIPSPQNHGPGAALDCLAGGGEMGALMRSIDWAHTPLGPVETWPQSLRTAVSVCLNSRFPILLWWGPELVMLYNDAYRPMLGVTKHPQAMGQRGRECWPEIWHIIGPMLEGVMERGEATWSDDQLLLLDRNGYLEESYFTFSYSPIRDEAGQVGGVFCAVTETTRRVLGERRLQTLRDLAAHGAVAKSVEEACRIAAEALASNPQDLPFALLYRIDETRAQARLVGAAGMGAGTAASPALVDLSAALSPWPLARVAASGSAELVEDFTASPGTPRQALVLPVTLPGYELPGVLLVAAINPRRALDPEYRSFFDLVAGQLAAAVSEARAYEEERRRAEALAELDRAKTIFFSNVSHEFRTPLTLMLAPLEDLRETTDGILLPQQREQLEIAHRNSLRLLKLVNTLLDFSRLEAGRIQAAYEPVDLAAFTAELASVFRSAIERAGLRLIVHCQPLEGPVCVDREMWEKIVLNLLSNAFKFTFEGEIEVSLRQAGETAELAVRDTGTGIPAAELAHLFERFHRVQGARGRTSEGSGIGLALVLELAKLHGGTVRVESGVDRGSTFTVAVPLGTAHLPADRIGEARTLASTRLRGEAYVAEALRWLPGDGVALHPEPLHPSSATGGSSPARILLADDNADMREYLQRLLSQRYETVAVHDGAAALQAAWDQPFDLVLSDVMMPRLDGFGLLAELRADERTRTLPVILLSARAGEEAEVEGLAAGADDYLVKPFSTRELLARVETHLKLQRVRREAQEALRASEEKFATAFGRSPLALTITAVDDGRLVEVNDGFVELSGYTREEAIGRKPEELGLWIEPEVRAERFVRLLAGERLPNGEARFRIKSGEELTGVIGSALVEINSRLCVLSSVTDITARKRAEEALREAQEKLQAALDGARLGTWSWDPSTNRSVADRRVLELFGFDPDNPPDEVSEIFRSIHPEDRPAVSEALRRAEQPGGQYYAEFRIQLPDGGLRWVAGAGRARLEGDSQAPRVYGVNFDVTDRKRAEEALREADRRKDEFLAMLAHELRNPLAPIRNAAQVLKLVGPAEDAHQQWAREVIERQTQHLTRLVDDLLEVSRITRGKVTLAREMLDLSAVIHRAVETSRPLIDARHHTLQVALPSEPVRLEGDLTRLVQVVGNLLNNAAKYTNEGGHLWLEAAAEDGEAVIRVRDDGMGLSADLLPHVFDLFTQADRSLDRSQGGLGIGLTLVRQLVDLHGGRVEARSDGPGQGSEFIVRLPAAAPADTADTQGAASEGTRPVSSALKILVVEDNMDSAEMLSFVLKLGGHEVRMAHDGLAALEAAHAFRPQVVLCDIGLPGMNGYEVAQRLRAQPELQQTRLIALTGYGQEEDRLRAHTAGFDYHLVKPVEPDALGALLNSLRSAE